MKVRLFSLCFTLIAVGACDQPRVVAPQDPAKLDRLLRAHLSYSGVTPILPGAPQDPAAVELGRALFFDKILSGNRDVSCATCHDPLLATTDGRSLSVGTGAITTDGTRSLGPGRQYVSRNAPSLLNAAGLIDMFWDARVAEPLPGQFATPLGKDFPEGLNTLLAVQAMFPVIDRVEMRGKDGDHDVLGTPNELATYRDDERTEIWDAIMQRLLAIDGYVTMFEAAYPDVPLELLRFQHAANAIGSFEMHALNFVNSAFDRYLAGDDDALSPSAKRGALLFFSRQPRCSACHFGPLLGSQTFAATATPQLGPGVGRDTPLDRGLTAPRVGQAQRFIFRTPPLRNVELTGPYMHAGTYATLEAVVRHYSDIPAALRDYEVTQLDPALRELYHGETATVDALLAALDRRLSVRFQFTDDEVTELVSFLQSLTDPAARDLSALIPHSVPSGLPVR